jgi:hypothetical protein
MSALFAIALGFLILWIGLIVLVNSGLLGDIRKMDQTKPLWTQIKWP